MGVPPGAGLLALCAPTLIALALIGLLPGVISMRKPWARWLLVACVAFFSLRYLMWRLSSTLALGDSWLGDLWSLSFAGVEILSILDAAVLFLVFARGTDRSPEADILEARLLARVGEDPAGAPKVDVYIPTYNESLAVLEKTIVGAMCMDWPNLAVYVLDDGRRSWLRKYCEEKGVGYITRADNVGAKAGNINHALEYTDGEFLAIFDADFVPQRTFLTRTLGFFEDPKVGIVQVPHCFYNHDPMQTNLAMSKSLPDDQRFFFEAIMPSRDAWGAAFCCGSNSVTRRSALRQVGDGLPHGSITEDMLLTLALLREGYVTRYLNEPLAFGLAPETVSAFFVQRQRWARGATQILFLKQGPLGPGLSLAHRLMFMPTHWLTHGLICFLPLFAPLIYLFTGLAPMRNISLETAIYYVAPMLVGVLGGLTTFGRGRYHPLAAQVLGTFQSFKVVPTVLATLIRPHGHVFKVTPKGSGATVESERPIFLTCVAIIVLTALGLVMNLIPEWRRVPDLSFLPLAGGLAAVNCVVLFLVALLCLQRPIRRQEERFDLEEPVMTAHRGSGGFATAMSKDMSVSGLCLTADESMLGPFQPGEEVETYVSSVGWVRGRVVRRTPGEIGVRFAPEGDQSELLIRKLFTRSRNTAAAAPISALGMTLELMKTILFVDTRLGPALPEPEPETPSSDERLPKAVLVAPPTERMRALAAAWRGFDEAA